MRTKDLCSPCTTALQCLEAGRCKSSNSEAKEPSMFWQPRHERCQQGCVSHHQGYAPCKDGICFELQRDTPREPNRDVSAGTSHTRPDSPTGTQAEIQGALSGAAPILSTEKEERWAVFCALCGDKWDVPYHHPGKSVCEPCERKHKALVSATPAINTVPLLKRIREQRDRLADVLRWLDALGGLGLDKHARIREALDGIPTYEEQLRNIAKGIGMDYDELLCRLDGSRAEEERNG